jgi:Effector Associated Constant Component 1
MCLWGETKMSIYIRTDGDAAEGELRSLYQWLLNEPEVRRNSTVSLVSNEPESGQMGAALEAIKLVVESGFEGLNLALAYAAWRATRPARPTVTIERNGTTISLSDADPGDVDKIVRILGAGEP